MYQDFKELLSALNAGQVRYLIVGGYAVSFHAQPRATKDLDILIGTDAANGKAIYAALAKFGGPIEGLSAKDFIEPDNFFRMGTPPVMVDIMPKISGVEFEEAWKRRVDVRIDENLSVPFISREDLLVAKLSAGRAQDLIDVDALRATVQGQELDRQQAAQLQTSAREELRAKGREDWLKLRQQRTSKNCGETNDPSAETAREKEPKNLPRNSGKGIDDDLD
jgi:hypothetical protein